MQFVQTSYISDWLVFKKNNRLSLSARSTSDAFGKRLWSNECVNNISCPLLGKMQWWRRASLHKVLVQNFMKSLKYLKISPKTWWNRISTNSMINTEMTHLTESALFCGHLYSQDLTTSEHMRWPEERTQYSGWLRRALCHVCSIIPLS